MISEIYVNGRKEDVWCETNTVISEELRKAVLSTKPPFECVVPGCLFLGTGAYAKLEYPQNSYYMCDNTALYKKGAVATAFVCQ